MSRYGPLPLCLVLLVLLAAAATATPQLLPLDDDPDIDARRSYLPPQGYLPPQDDAALGAAAAPQRAVAPAPGEQCGHAFHSFLCGRGRRPGAATAPEPTFLQPSRLRPELSPTPSPLPPNPQYQATFLLPSRVRPPSPNALPPQHLNCTSHATLEVRPPPAPQPIRDPDPAPSVPSFRLLYTPQKVALPNDINKQTKEHNCTSEATLKVVSPASLPPSYSRQPPLPLERRPYPPSTLPPSYTRQPAFPPERIPYPSFYVEQTRVPPSHDSANCSSQTTESPTTTPPPRRVFADPSPQPSATFESARIASLPNHPPGCTCGADHSAGSSVDATFISPERVAPPQQFRTTTARATTTTSTTTTTERPSPRPLEPLAAAPEPAVVAAPKLASWSEEDSCSHAFHSFLCRKPQAAASTRRKALAAQPVQGDSSFISAASLPAPKKVPPPPSVPTRAERKRQPQTDPPTTTTTTTTTRRAPPSTAAPPSRRPPSTPPPATTAKPTTVASGPVIEPQAAQDAPVVAVPRPGGDDGHHHHHHEGKDLCSDPFHSFLCQKVDTNKRRRVYGRLPQSPLPAGSSPDRARVDGPAFVGDSTFVKSAAVPPPRNFVSSASPTPTPRPTFTSSISPFTTPPPQQRRKPTPAIRDEYSELPRYFTASRRPATTTETVRTTPVPPCHTEGGPIHQPTIATFTRLFPQFPSFRSEQAASNVLTTVSDPAPRNVPYQKPRAPAVYPSTRFDTYSTVAHTVTTVAPVFFNRITAAQTKSAPPAVFDPRPQERPRPAASNSQPVTPCVKLGGKCVDVTATKQQPSAFASSASAPVRAERISTPRPPSPTARTTTPAADNDVQPAAAQNDDARVLPDNTAEHGHDHHDDHDHHHHHHSGNICDDPFHSFLCEPTKPRRRFDGRPQTSGNRKRPPTIAGGSLGLGGPPLEGAGSFLNSATLAPPTSAKPRSQGRFSLDKPQVASDEALPAAAQQQEVVGYLYPQPATPLRYPGESVRINLFPQQGELRATAQSFVSERSNDIRTIEKIRSSAGSSVKRDTLHAASDADDVTGDRQLSETSVEQSSASDSQPTRWSWAQTAA